MTLDKEIIEQIPILYKELRNQKKVADKLGISQASVRKYLKLADNSDAAIAERERFQKAKEETLKLSEKELSDLINKLYSEERNMAKIGRDLGLSTSTIKRYLNEENLELNKNRYEDRDALWYYIYRLFGHYSEDCPVNPWNVTQMNKFFSQGMTYKGQLLSLKYFYEIKKNSTKKANGSIGIIPYVYGDAALYYEKEAKKADELAAAIKKQLEKDRIEIKYNPKDYINKRPRKKKINLDEIGEE